jgi:hypothetical protein
MRVLNISAGGFLVDASLELPRGAVEQCAVTSEGGQAVLIRERVVHVLPRRLATDASYLIGLEFLETNTGIVGCLTAECR